MPDERFLTIPEAAVIARIHARTLYRLIANGRIPAYGFLNAYRVKLSDVLSPVKPQRRKQGARASSKRARLANSVAQAESVAPGTSPDTRADSDAPESPIPSAFGW